MISILSALALLPFAFAAPLLEQRDGPAIPGKYFVILKPETGSVTASMMGDLAGGALAGVDREHTYNIGSFNGFAAKLTDEQILALKADSRVSLFIPRKHGSVLIVIGGVPGA
jgi:Peptidase inhibitor I9